MSGYKCASLKSLLDDLERYSAKFAGDELKSDLVSLITETLSYVSECTNIPELESRLIANASVDTNGLELLLKTIKKLCVKYPPVVLPNRNIDPDLLIKEFSDYVTRIVVRAPLLDVREMILLLDLVGNRIFNDLLFCIADNKVSVEPLQKMVLAKLNKVPDESIAIMWNKVLSEFDQSRLGPKMIPDPAVVSDEFFQFTNTRKTREKVAKYIVDVKPRLLLSMFQRETFSYPTEAIGAVRILASLSEDIVISINETEIMLARAISHLAYLWKNVLSQDIGIIADILHISTKDRLLSGPEFIDAQSSARQDLATNAARLFFEIRKILNITESLVTCETPVESALHQYKLGLEIMVPEILDEFMAKNELLLQKELYKFLIERNIFAYGTKFVRNETELKVEYLSQSYTIETKLYQPQDDLTESSLIKDITQLQSYMDQTPTPGKGILVIYNMTDSLLETPRNWLYNRYWVLAINLQKEPPGNRKQTITIEQSDDSSTLIRASCYRSTKSARGR